MAPTPESQQPHSPTRPHVDLSERILSVSATMVGVCLTVIGLVRVADELSKVRSITDNVVAIDAVLFLAAAVCAYASVRSADPKQRLVLERIADSVFLAALVGMTAVCGLIAYEIV